MDQLLHWVRPGLLCFAAVMSTGALRIWSCTISSQSFQWAERKTSISGLGESLLTAADIVTGPMQTLRVCCVKQVGGAQLLYSPAPLPLSVHGPPLPVAFPSLPFSLSSALGDHLAGFSCVVSCLLFPLLT